jgi:hypothetical protein
MLFQPQSKPYYLWPNKNCLKVICMYSIALKIRQTLYCRLFNAQFCTSRLLDRFWNGLHTVYLPVIFTPLYY